MSDRILDQLRPGNEVAQQRLDELLAEQKKAQDPPSKFSKMCLDYSATCPSKGPGVARDKYENWQMFECHKTTTVAGQGFRGRKMSKARFVKWATCHSLFHDVCYL